jgi:hypothetical protein
MALSNILSIPDLLLDKNYSSIIDILYGSLPILIIHLDDAVREDYTHTRASLDNKDKDKVNDLTSLLDKAKSKKSDILADPLVLMSMRELVIYLSKKLARLTIDENNVKFHVLQVNDETQIKLLILYLIFFHYDALVYSQSKSNSKSSSETPTLSRYLYSGLDFEFNQRKIALCQIVLFNTRKQKIIWVFNPTMLDTVNTKYLIDYFFTSKYIKKLVHGADSLDIPYLFQEMFANNTNYIYAYVMNLIDTRFYCEYFKTAVSFQDKKCSIYDAMLFFDTIDQAKYDELQHISQTMGPVQDVNWNVANMSSFNLKYSVYDVLYLHDFYTDILKKARQETRLEYKSYAYIAHFTKFIFLEKYKVSNILDFVKSKIDPINNYLVKLHNKVTNKTVNLTLITIYNNIIKDFTIKHKKLVVNLTTLFGINYFRTPLVMLYKYVIYAILLDNYIVFKTKDNRFNEKINLQDLFAGFKDIEQYKMRTFMQLFYEKAQSSVRDYIHTVRSM